MALGLAVAVDRSAQTAVKGSPSVSSISIRRYYHLAVLPTPTTTHSSRSQKRRGSTRRRGRERRHLRHNAFFLTHSPPIPPRLPRAPVLPPPLNNRERKKKAKRPVRIVLGHPLQPRLGPY
ncbi:hypothetical protein FRB91_000456 [Serendipita sp. 411]|nr:hypothetical protein FRB91_000456 [Serendipita sp. 411]